MEYIPTSKIEVTVVDSSNDESVLDITNRNPFNIGELFTKSIGSKIIYRELEGNNMPKKVMLIATIEFELK